ncbi:MAG: TRAP transporter permease, partial [Pseudomonadota bacterium]
GASAFRTGLEAMRLGGVLYIVPFFFVLNPALVGEAPAVEVVSVFTCAMLGVWLIAGAIQGHVSFVGGLGEGLVGLAMRLWLFAAGFLVAAPGATALDLPIGHWEITGLGLLLAVLPLMIAWKRNPERIAA